jgi:hypothetical protein
MNECYGDSCGRHTNECQIFDEHEPLHSGVGVAYAQQAILVIPTIREDVPLLEERSSTAGESLRGAQVCLANSLGPITLGTRAQAWSGSNQGPRPTTVGSTRASTGETLSNRVGCRLEAYRRIRQLSKRIVLVLSSSLFAQAEPVVDVPRSQLPRTFFDLAFLCR